MTNAPTSNRDALLQLYDATHGTAVTDIRAPSLGTSPETRIRRWKAIWRRLQFDKAEPTGSSRLFEVANALAAADGNPTEMLSALFQVLQGVHPINTAFESLLKELWNPAHCNRKAFGALFDSLRPVPGDLTQRQAYLVVRFLWERELYSDAEIKRLREVLADPTVELIEIP